MVRGLVLDMVRLFGARRCMFASNWHMHGAMSNTDSMDASADTVATLAQLHEKFVEWTAELPLIPLRHPGGLRMCTLVPHVEATFTEAINMPHVSNIYRCV